MRIAITIFFCLCSVLAYTQRTLSTKSKKAAELYYEADNFRVRGQYKTALDLLGQALQKDKNFHEAYFRSAIIYKAKGDLDKAEQYFKKVLELNRGNNAPSYFELGELYLQLNDFEQSLLFIDKFLSSGSRHQRRIEEARRIKENAQFGIDNADLASQYNPRPLSDTVNAFPMQYFPIVSVDQGSLIFTRRLGTTMEHDEDLVVSVKNKDGSWSKPVSISENINSEFNEGTCTISGDGRTLIFTSCYGRNGYGSCDLYISRKTGEEWSTPENLGPNINTPAWESQPSLSADGRALYFISDRKDGVGKRDIWVSFLDDTGTWGKPVNLGINTRYDEVSPFIHPNNSTLYFASNGLKGFGGFDIYYSEREAADWGDPVNLGYPINTGEDQVSLFITSDGEKGYYSHEDNNDPGRKGRIYEFDVPEGSKVRYRTSYVFGKVFSEDTKEPLGAEIELYDLARDERVSLVSSDAASGQYLIVLKEGSDYALYVNKEGYLFKSLSFSYTSGVLEPVELDIYLSAIEAGAVTVLKNIFFDIDKYDLKEESKTELKKVVRFLTANPATRIEITGHTDNTGDRDYNYTLSGKRAASVYNYLVSEGIPSNLLSSRGLGPDRPIADNNSEANRQKNRRIEFRIITP